MADKDEKLVKPFWFNLIGFAKVLKFFPPREEKIA
jgi:hypothetical protein